MTLGTSILRRNVSMYIDVFMEFSFDTYGSSS